MPAQPGQDAFGAIQEIVLMILSAAGLYLAERFVGMDVIFGARK